MGLFTVKRVVIPELEEKVIPWLQRNAYTPEEDRIIMSYYGRARLKDISSYLERVGQKRTPDAIRRRYKRLTERGVNVVD